MANVYMPKHRSVLRGGKVMKHREQHLYLIRQCSCATLQLWVITVLKYNATTATISLHRDGEIAENRSLFGCVFTC